MIVALFYIQGVIQCLSCYLVFLYLQLFLLLFMHTVYLHELFPLHTLTRSRSDDPRFARPDIGRFVYVVQVFDETIHIARRLSLPLILVFSSFLYSCYFHDSPFTASSCHFLSVIHLLSCVVLHVLLQ